MITDEQIKKLRDDATAVRNPALARKCTQALRGDVVARKTVEDVFNGTYEPAPREPQSFPVEVTDPDGTTHTEWITI